jgi:hypothetical protein
MFLSTIRYLGFLKHIYGIAWVFDSYLKFYSFLAQPHVLDSIDHIEQQVLRWPGVTRQMHKYGGIQFNAGKHEIGHIHSNGLLDMLLTRRLKQQLMLEGRIQDHHSFKNSGWISFHIRSAKDKEYALKLLNFGYKRLDNRATLNP